MANMITDASDGSAARISAARGQLGARWTALLGYLTAAGFCEQQLRDIQDILMDISFRDIDISIRRLYGEKHDLTIGRYVSAAGLKKRIAGEWAIQASSLRLAIGSKFLRDGDVIAEFVSSTDRVVTAVVSAPRALQDRDQSTEVNDEIRVKLENVASYMDELEKQYLMIHWEQSCRAAQESCEAAAAALARISKGLRIPIGDSIAIETVKDARNEILKAVLKRVEGWQLSNTLYSDKILGLSETLACEAGCRDPTVFQLVNTARRLAEERHGQQARGRVRGLGGQNIQNGSRKRSRCVLNQAC